MTTKKKALVLGGATGLLGQTIVQTLKNTNEWEVETLGRENDSIFNKVFLQETLEKISPDVIFNTIAYTQVDLAETDKETAYKVNRDFPALLGKLLEGTETSLIHYSTDFVFDGKKNSPYTETDTPNPLSVYGASKLAGEQALQSLNLKQCLIIRTSWLFGPGKKNFISTILHRAKETGELRIIHDQIGSPSYTLGLAANSLLLLNKGSSGLYHLTNSGFSSWYEFAQEAVTIADICATVCPITSNDYPQAAQRPSFSVLSTEKFIQETGVTPRAWVHSLRDYIYNYFLPQ